MAPSHHICTVHRWKRGKIFQPPTVSLHICMQVVKLAYTLLLKIGKIPHVQYKEIQKRLVAKSYMRRGFLMYEEICEYLVIDEEDVNHIL